MCRITSGLCKLFGTQWSSYILKERQNGINMNMGMCIQDTDQADIMNRFDPSQDESSASLFHVGLSSNPEDMGRDFEKSTWLGSVWSLFVQVFVHEWPLLDWKLGIFLWRNGGFILLAIALVSIVPGSLHAWSGRVLKWPVLWLTGLLISVELVVYVVIRLFIRLAEYAVATPKHHRLRRNMAQAQSYGEWYKYASQLNRSQKRDKWLQNHDHESSTHYNWALIVQLIKDMQSPRSQGDSVLALAVIQQCTRLNVGGIMNIDLFSYSNTGEPKQIVKDFIEEVISTLYWITEQADSTPGTVTEHSMANPQQSESSKQNKEEFCQRIKAEFLKEKEKLWHALVRPTGSSGEIPSNNENSNHETTNHRIPDHPRITGATSQPIQMPSAHRDQVLKLLKRARAAYGRTALCLSGGGMLGLYHLGVLRAMVRGGTLPQIISGASAGSVVGAVVCTRTDQELEGALQPEVIGQYMTCFHRPWKDQLVSVWKTGNRFELKTWMKK